MTASAVNDLVVEPMTKGVVAPHVVGVAVRPGARRLDPTVGDDHDGRTGNAGGVQLLLEDPLDVGHLNVGPLDGSRRPRSGRCSPGAQHQEHRDAEQHATRWAGVHAHAGVHRVPAVVA